MAKYILKTYQTDDIIAEANAKFTNFTQPAGMTAVSYSEDLYEKAPRCSTVYNASSVKGFY